MKSFSFYSFIVLTFLLASCKPDHKSPGNNTSVSSSSSPGDSSISLSEPTTCAQYHRKHCDPGKGEGWLYNAQSRSGIFFPGSTSKIRCVIYKGMDYRMSVCGEQDTKIRFKLYDSRTNELLYDNATVEYADVFEFPSTTTRQLIAEITLHTVPAGKAESCVGFLIYHKLTER